ncbi:hypothetical protein QW180_25435 [Vibrio sinaloensis]|nr:hypothetical protein [Vibrio sinaloensis]
MRSLLNTTYNNAYPSNADFKAVGHGFIEGNVPGGTELLQTDLDYISTSDCRTEIGSQITTKQLCFGGEMRLMDIKIRPVQGTPVVLSISITALNTFRLA